MSVQLPDGFSVEYSYEKEFSPEGRCLRYTTTATLYNENEIPVCFGQAFLNPKDTPCKKTGRDKATGRAVQIYYQLTGGKYRGR